MGLFSRSRGLSTNADKTPAFLTEKGQKKGWGMQSIILTIATGALVLAVAAAVLSMIGNPLKSHSSPPTSTTTATPAAVTAIAPSATPVIDDSKAVDGNKTFPTRIQDCGNTPAEARAKGCVFDVMMQLWTPADCFDRKLSDRFLAIGNWTWYADSSAEHTYTLDEMRKGEHDFVFVAQDYHVTHCIYAWEKLVRNMRNQEPIITELISYDHVIHCRHKTLMRTDNQAIRGVRAPTAYTQCAPYDTWKYHLPPNEHSTTD
jgi:hypothetical protein